jgi:2Fe-2S ferredoxin
MVAMRKPLTVGSLIPGRNRSAPLPAAGPRPNQSVPKQKPVIRLLQNDREFRVQPVAGQLLLEAALNQLQPLRYKCQKGSCGQCAVRLLSGSRFLSAPSPAEWEKLGNSLQAGYRLACQAAIQSE